MPLFLRLVRTVALAMFFALTLIMLYVCVVAPSPLLARQGAIYTPGAVVTLVPAFPPACTNGNIIILAVAQDGFAAGTMHICLMNMWTPVVPTSLVVNGPLLPATCLQGALFTLTPTGALFTCPAPNTFVPVGATIVANKTIAGIQNNVFTDVATITVPNMASGALIEITLTGSLGAGGAIGAYEATTGRTVIIAVTRTPNLATVATIITSQDAIDARVVGATTITQTTQLSAITGLPNVQQTFTLQYRIARGGGVGMSNNHIASLTTRVVSPTLTNITIQ